MGQSSTKPDAVEQKIDGDAQDGPKTPQQEKDLRRRSFYETVDASEVLPYLIIGKCHNQLREKSTASSY